MKNAITSLFLLSTTTLAAQIFQDGPGQENDGDFPAKWDLIKGSAEIDTFQGEKVISLAHRGIITPLLNSKDYLPESFTLEFDAYFDEVATAMYYQYYDIRFWEGSGIAIVNGNGFYEPIHIYRNGVRIIGRSDGTTPIRDEVYNKNFEEKESAWRSIIINYNKGALKVSINGTQILNQPRFLHQPTMVSIGSLYSQGTEPFTRGIKNFRISGIENSSSNTSDTVDGPNNPNLVRNSQSTENPDKQSSLDQTVSNAPIPPSKYGTQSQILPTEDRRVVSDLPSSSIPGNANESATVKPTGLEAIDEGNGTGWRLIGRDPKRYGNIGAGAIDFSEQQMVDGLPGAFGSWSVAAGLDTHASGVGSLAIGKNTRASGDYSNAMGDSTAASGNYSFAIGRSTTASAETATAMGDRTTASGIHSIAMGSNSSATGVGSIAMGDSTRATGDHSTALGYHTIASGDYSTSLGENTKALGVHSFATGLNTEASGKYATAMGLNSLATNDNATAFGLNTMATGPQSTTFGTDTKAMGKTSLATGVNTTASGIQSTAMGSGTQAQSAHSMAVGQFNIGGGDALKAISTDPLFEVGYGASNSDRKNALTVLKNGSTGVGTHKPRVKLHVDGGEDATLHTGGYLMVGDKSNRNLVFDEDEIMARRNVQASTLYLQNDGGDVFVGGAVVHSSDERLKQDIEDLSFGLTEVLQLRPVAYHWKSDPQAAQKSVGLIAQEVQSVLNDLVTTNTSRDNTLGVNYTELIPILVNAIQEQQAIIESQRSENEKLTASLSERIQKLEALLDL